ncbi:hypothetical protein TOPH_01676, partial [Tolypocladium ophioglossoides CBS 100239]
TISSDFISATTRIRAIRDPSPIRPGCEETRNRANCGGWTRTLTICDEAGRKRAATSRVVRAGRCLNQHVDAGGLSEVAEAEAVPFRGHAECVHVYALGEVYLLLHPLPALQPGLHRSDPVPPAPHLDPGRPRVVLHPGRGH